MYTYSCMCTCTCVCKWKHSLMLSVLLSHPMPVTEPGTCLGRLNSIPWVSCTVVGSLPRPTWKQVHLTLAVNRSLTPAPCSALSSFSFWGVPTPLWYCCYPAVLSDFPGDSSILHRHVIHHLESLIKIQLPLLTYFASAKCGHKRKF